MRILLGAIFGLAVALPALAGDAVWTVGPTSGRVTTNISPERPRAWIDLADTDTSLPILTNGCASVHLECWVLTGTPAITPISCNDSGDYTATKCPAANQLAVDIDSPADNVPNRTPMDCSSSNLVAQGFHVATFVGLTVSGTTWTARMVAMCGDE